MMLLKSFFRRIIKDFQHKELLPLKLIFFVQASTLYVLYPYLTIHMRELGINVEETAIMSAVTPFVAIVMPPLAGMIADRIGNFKMLLSFFSSLGGGAALLLLLVPVGRVTVRFPERVVMDLSCPGSESELIYTMSQNHPCETKLQANVATRIESCGYACQADLQNETEQNSLLQTRIYAISRLDPEDPSRPITETFASTADELPNPEMEEDVRETRRMRNNDFYGTSVRRLSKSAYYFPTRRLYDFRCYTRPKSPQPEVSRSNGTTGSETGETMEKRHEIMCEFGKSARSAKIVTDLGRSVTKFADFPSFLTLNGSVTSKLRPIESNYIDRLEKKRRFIVEETLVDDPIVSSDRKPIPIAVRCENPDEGPEIGRVIVNVPLALMDADRVPYKNLTLENCSKRCVLSAPRSSMCANAETVVEYNVRLTFWLYLGIRVFLGIIGGTAFAMFEGAVIAILREQKADYGLQRIYGSIGGMISSPLSGLLIDYASRGKGYTDFRPAFYLYAALKIASGILMLSINLEFKSPASNVVSDVVSALKNVEIVALLLAVFVLGTAWGYIESFLFWLLQDLGGSRSLMGITITVGGIAGIPLLVLSGPLIEKIGHANVLFIGFVFYAVRLIGYSIIYNPWLSLIFEALESVTSSLSSTAAVTYAAKLSTTTTDSSIQGLLGGLYYGVGKGSGSLIGGYLIKAFGMRKTYQIFAAMTLLTGILYFLFNIFVLKKRGHVEGNDIVKGRTRRESGSKGMDNVGMEMTLEKSELGRIETSGTKNGGEKIYSKNQEEIEMMNNAKNLDVIEKIQETEPERNGKKKNSREEKSKSGSREKNRKKNSSEKRESAGNENLAFVKMENGDSRHGSGRCDVTVEKLPEEK